MNLKRRELGPNIGFQESDTVEFKEKWVEDAMSDIVAFANTRGGTLYLGVNKNGNVVPGADVSDQHQQEIANKIRNHLGILADIRIEERSGYAYLAVNIQRVEGRSVVLRGQPWRRSGTTSFQVPQEEWGALALAQIGRSWDDLPADASVATDIDPAKVRAFIQSAHGRERPRLPQGIREDDPVDLNLDKLGLLRDGRPTNAALLLFGKDPQRRCRHARVRVLFFRDINDFDEYPECTGTLFEQIDAALRAIAVANPSRITFGPRAEPPVDVLERTRRHEATVYPEIALKEAITNAVIHRDYTVVGSEVEVKIFPDRLVITNPGMLMPGLTVEELRHDPHPSRRRNPLIAEVAAIDYWVERAGTGTTRMIEMCHDAGLPAPTFENRSSGFTVEFLRDPWTKQRLAGLGLNERQLLAMSHVRTHGSIRLKEHRALTGAPERTAARDLRELAERGLLNKEGAGAATRYVLGSLPTLP